MSQSISIAALSIIVGAFVLSVLVIEIKAALTKLRKKKSPQVIRGYHE